MDPKAQTDSMIVALLNKALSLSKVLRREGKLADDAVSVQRPLVMKSLELSSRRKRSLDDGDGGGKDPSFLKKRRFDDGGESRTLKSSEECTVGAHRISQGGEDDAVSVEPLRLKSIEQETKRQSFINENDGVLRLKYCADLLGYYSGDDEETESEEDPEEEIDEDGNVVVFAEPLRWVITEESKRQRCAESSSSKGSRGQDDDEEEEEFVEGFFKPWMDFVGQEGHRSGDADAAAAQNPSSASIDDIAALTLLQISRADTDKKTQTQLLQLQKAMAMVTQPQRREEEEEDKTTFKCSVCGKQFSSYQALGGHKASHRIKPPQPLVENADIGEEKKKPKSMPPSGKIHKCSVCAEVFPTGQALGGHKRRHFSGMLGAQRQIQENEVVLSLAGCENGRDKSPSNGSVVINVSDQEPGLRPLFDLNKPPSREFDDDNVEEAESAIVLAI